MFGQFVMPPSQDPMRKHLDKEFPVDLGEGEQANLLLKSAYCGSAGLRVPEDERGGLAGMAQRIVDHAWAIKGLTEEYDGARIDLRHDRFEISYVRLVGKVGHIAFR